MLCFVNAFFCLQREEWLHLFDFENIWHWTCNRAIVEGSRNKQKRGEQITQNNNCALTTFDNPYNPFEQFTSWFLFDVEKGYNSCGYLARIAKTSESFSDQENEEEIERAIDEIVFYDPFNIYRKVRRNDFKQATAWQHTLVCRRTGTPGGGSLRLHPLRHRATPQKFSGGIFEEAFQPFYESAEFFIPPIFFAPFVCRFFRVRFLPPPYKNTSADSWKGW